MNPNSSHPLRLAALVLSAILPAASALADKPAWAGKNGNKQMERHDDRGGQAAARFTDQHRLVIAEYYGGQNRFGNKCPPGLARKNNGCMPPGLAKKWRMGRPLPVDMAYYELPHDLLTRLPPPPAGHRYVRIAADILLIVVGSTMVIDAVEDLVR